MAAAAIAMALANSPLSHTYHDALHHPLAWTPLTALPTLHHWINDGLMALFFFVVGLEIKREVFEGELSDPVHRRLPVVAAVAGMAVPALIFLAAGGSAPALRNGWAIPAATDIAFALGVLAMVGRRAPPSLRLFLLTVAIVDDLGAVAIIALFYTGGIKLAWLVGALACIAVMILLGRLRHSSNWVFAALAALCWVCTLHSGVHATVAGVAAAFAIPLRIGRSGHSMLHRMEHALVPWNGYVIVPLFGLANAGVSFTAPASGEAFGPLPLAIAAGLFIGKPVGILGAIFAADRAGFASKPEGASWLQLWGIAMLCGIGFTMSLFIAQLAFPEHPGLVEEAKLGTFVGSLASALAGLAILALAGRSRTAA